MSDSTPTTLYNTLVELLRKTDDDHLKVRIADYILDKVQKRWESS